MIVVSLIVFAIAATGSLTNTIIASIAVPVFYSLFNGLYDFAIRRGVKGGEYGLLRVWTEDAAGIWRLDVSSLEKLVTLHRNRHRIKYVERSVNLREVNPYLLGLNLTTGAFAVYAAVLYNGQANSTYLTSSFLVLTVITLCLAALMFSNQTAVPNQRAKILLTAVGSIALGTIAIATVLLLLTLGSA